MARLKFIRGAISGRLGELVGASWKGINYIRTFQAPANPRTPAQQAVRHVFAEISHFATALFSLGLFRIIPPARRMTERNSVFKANGNMLTNHSFSSPDLQVSAPTLITDSAAVSMSPSSNGTGYDISYNAQVVGDVPAAPTLSVVLYDPLLRRAVGMAQKPVLVGANGSVTQTASIAVPSSFQSPSVLCYALVSGELDTGRLVVSKTVCNVQAFGEGYISGFLDADENEYNSIFVTGNAFRIAGNGLRFDDSAPDEGVFFVNNSNPTIMEKVSRLALVTNSLIVGISNNPTGAAGDTFDVVVYTRHGNPSGVLVAIAAGLQLEKA